MVNPLSNPDGSGVRAAALVAGDPERLGGYRLEGRLGSGGQGTVYLGRSPAGVPVAVKVLRTDWAAEPQAKARFAREVEAARRVARFCTAQVLDADLDAERPYVVSEYVDGPTLHHVVTAEGPRSGAALERLAVATACALVAIHQVGIVHRDLKPGNVLLGPDGPRVIDFGIATALQHTSGLTSGVIGTPAYMAPEQFDGGAITPAADVFAWAGVMAFAGTGRRPFDGETVNKLMYQILNGEPRLGDLRGDLRDLVVECFSKDPGGRPAAVELLLRLLGRGDGRAVDDDTVTTAMLAAVAEASKVGPATSAEPGAEPGGAVAAGPAPVVAAAALPASGTTAPITPAPGGASAAEASTTEDAAPVPATATTAPAPARGAWRARARRGRALLVPLLALALVGGGVVGLRALLPSSPRDEPRVTDGGGGTAGGAVAAPTPSAGEATSTTAPATTTTLERGAVPKAFVGVWEGRGRQATGSRWDIVMRISGGRGPVVGRIRYSNPCAGTLTLAKAGARSLELRETIYEGAGRCITSGRITVELRSDGRLDWYYLDNQGRSDSASLAVLRRRG